jgi:hypothetical protein
MKFLLQTNGHWPLEPPGRAPYCDCGGAFLHAAHCCCGGPRSTRAPQKSTIGADTHGVLGYWLPGHGLQPVAGVGAGAAMSWREAAAPCAGTGKRQGLQCASACARSLSGRVRARGARRGPSSVLGARRRARLDAQERAKQRRAADLTHPRTEGAEPERKRAGLRVRTAQGGGFPQEVFRRRCCATPHGRRTTVALRAAPEHTMCRSGA